MAAILKKIYITS